MARPRPKGDPIMKDCNAWAAGPFELITGGGGGRRVGDPEGRVGSAGSPSSSRARGLSPELIWAR